MPLQLDLEDAEPARYLDIANGRALAEWHGRDMRYCDVLGAWHLWTHKRWERALNNEEREPGKSTALRLLAEARQNVRLAREQLREAETRLGAATETDTKKLRKAVGRCKKHSQHDRQQAVDAFHSLRLRAHAVAQARGHDVHVVAARGAFGYQPAMRVTCSIGTETFPNEVSR